MVQYKGKIEKGQRAMGTPIFALQTQKGIVTWDRAWFSENRIISENHKTIPFDISCTRGKWANPFRRTLNLYINPNFNLLASIEVATVLRCNWPEFQRIKDLYALWILTQPQLLLDVWELYGSRLGCWCVPPTPCHCEILVDLAVNMVERGRIAA